MTDSLHGVAGDPVNTNDDARVWLHLSSVHSGVRVLARKGTPSWTPVAGIRHGPGSKRDRPFCLLGIQHHSRNLEFNWEFYNFFFFLSLYAFCRREVLQLSPCVFICMREYIFPDSYIKAGRDHVSGYY